jgi:cytochrome o ubiquinol oxidase subunit IV
VSTHDNPPVHSHEHGHDHGHGHGHGHHAHDDHGGAAHGTRKGYWTGFILSVLLTAPAFALVMTGVIADARITAGIVTALAAVQIVVHMVYFLHMNSKSENGWTLLALIFTVIIVVIAIAGSLWVMYNMNVNMMPGMHMEMTSGGM